MSEYKRGRFIDFAAPDWTMEEYLRAPARSRSSLVLAIDDVRGPGKGVGKFGGAVHRAVEDPQAFEREVMLLPDRFTPPGPDDTPDRWDAQLAIRPIFRGDGAKAEGKAWDQAAKAKGLTITNKSGYGTAKRALVKAEEHPMAFSREDVKRVWRCVDAIRRRRFFDVPVGDWIDAGKMTRERTLTCTDSVTGLRVKIRKDLTLHVAPDKTCVLDIKVHEEPQESAFERAAAAHWYGLQAALYADVEADYVGMADSAPFGWLVVGAHPDSRGIHPTAYYEAGANWKTLGRIAYQAALVIAKADAGRETPLPRYWGHGPRTLDTPPLWHVQAVEQIQLHARSIGK